MIKGAVPKMQLLNRGAEGKSEGRHVVAKPAISDGELFIIDNSDKDWKVVDYLRGWCELSRSVDIATGSFETGSLLALEDEWQKVDQIRVLMGDECRTA